MVQMRVLIHGSVAGKVIGKHLCMLCFLDLLTSTHIRYTHSLRIHKSKKDGSI